MCGHGKQKSVLGVLLTDPLALCIHSLPQTRRTGDMIPQCILHMGFTKKRTKRITTVISYVTHRWNRPYNMTCT